MAETATQHQNFQTRTTINKLVSPCAVCASSSHFLPTNFEICRSILTLLTPLAESMTWSMTWKWTLLATYLLFRNKTIILKQRGRGSKWTYGRIGIFGDILDEAKLSLICRQISRFILKSTLCPVLSVVMKMNHRTWYLVPGTWYTDC